MQSWRRSLKAIVGGFCFSLPAEWQFQIPRAIFFGF
jgi:hypothetical protein